MKEPTLSHFLYDVLWIAFGGMCLLIAAYVPADVGMFLFVLSVGFMPIGCFCVVLDVYRLEKLRKFHEMRNANRGIIWVWVVGMLGLFVFAIVYISVAWPVMLCMDLIEGSYSFSTMQSQTFLTIRTVFAWTPLIFIFGVIMWMLVNSARREEATYPVYYG